jgi:protein-disulfide isomerase
MTAGERDLTRRERRESARAQRRAAELAAAARTARRRRLRLLGAIAAVAVAAIAVAVSAGTSGGGPSGPASAQRARATAQVSRLLAGIDESGETLGARSAPVSITYYGDLECPVCRLFTLTTLPSLIANDVRAGRVSITYHAIETATADPQVFAEQQAAALAAGQQRRFWYYAELFYHEQGQEDSGYVTNGFLEEIARQVPRLDYVAWQAGRASPVLAARVAAENGSAIAGGVNETPTLVIDGRRGAVKVVGVLTYASFERAIQSVA